MLDKLENICKRAAFWLACGGAFAMVLMMVLTFMDVTGRTFFGRALTGTVESVTLLMGTVVFCGLAWTQVENKHVVVDTFLVILPKPLQNILQVLNSTIAVGVGGFLAWQLVLHTISIIEEGEVTQIWEMPYWPTAIVMVLGMLLFVVILTLSFCRSLQALTNSRNR